LKDFFEREEAVTPFWKGVTAERLPKEETLFKKVSPLPFEKSLARF